MRLIDNIAWAEGKQDRIRFFFSLKFFPICGAILMNNGYILQQNWKE
jgi:hypothetical protein